MKTVRELGERVIEAGKRSDDGGAYFPGFEGGVYALMEAIGEDAIVIEPSGVVLAVDREKLAKVLCVARHCSDQNDEQYTDTPLCRACNAPAIVDAILTSMAEQGFREVEELRHIAVPEWQIDIVVPVLVSDEVFRTHEARGCRYVDIASLKPLPPAKED